MIAWHYVTHFTPQQAALAIIGEPPTDDPRATTKAAPVLAELRRAYEQCRRSFAQASDDAFMLMSDEMRMAQGRTETDLAAVAGDFRFLTWLRTPMADFEHQHFTPDVLAAWLKARESPSAFGFSGMPRNQPPAKSQELEKTTNNPDTQEPPQPMRKARPRYSVKRSVLIENHLHHWSTIKGDLQDASKNGLAEAAKAKSRDWYEEEALAWARSRGKLTDAVATPAQDLAKTMNSMASLPTRRHVLLG